MEYRGIEGYGRYLAGSDGYIYQREPWRKMPRCMNGRKPCTNLIRDDGVKVLAKVHRLVAEAFHGKHGEHVVIFLDGDATNASAENLGWRAQFATIPKDHRDTHCASIYRNLVNRCHNPNTKSYPLYGGRGAVVCQGWLEDFLTFKAWYDEHYVKGWDIRQLVYGPGTCHYVPRGINGLFRRVGPLNRKLLRARVEEYRGQLHEDTLQLLEDILKDPSYAVLD